MKYKLVLTTFNAEKTLNDSIKNELKSVICETSAKFDVRVNAIAMTDNIVLVDMVFHPNLMPSKFINSLKTVSSRLIRKNHANHFDSFYSQKSLWARAYCLVVDSNDSLPYLEDYIEKMRNVHENKSIELPSANEVCENSCL